jgi:aspartyl-tRNA(Asn)/glutamyl-tRNA(Gln) amidotransferase subunit A
MNGVRLGLVADYAFRDLDADVESSFNEALRLARSLGAVIEPLKLDTVSDYQDVETAFSEILSYEFNRIITSVYGSNDWERLLGPTGTLDAENGSRVTQRKYEARLAEKVGITADLRKVFRTVDALICPATPHTAPFLHSDLSVFERARQFAVPFSYAGLPAIVVPCGLSREGFPVGLQIVGDRYEERRLLHIAKAFEDALDFRALPTVI